MDIKLLVNSGSPCWRDSKGHQVYQYNVDLGGKDVCKVYSTLDIVEDIPCVAGFVLCSKRNVLTLILQNQIEKQEKEVL